MTAKLSVRTFFVFIAALWFTAPNHAAAEAAPSKPNIVFIIADDKYESTEANARAMRDMTRFPVSCHEFWIAANRGQLAAITWN